MLEKEVLLLRVMRGRKTPQSDLSGETTNKEK
jgi:hypothetical protein